MTNEISDFSVLKVGIDDFEGTSASYEIAINRLVTKHNALVDRVAEELKAVKNSISVIQDVVIDKPIDPS